MTFKLELWIALLSIIYQVSTQSLTCNHNCACPFLISGRTCILNCGGKDQCKDSTLRCRAGDPCQVNCNGDNACGGNAIIDASRSTDVTVNCIGDEACKGNVILNCGTKSCDISCTTSSSCINTKVNVNQAMSFECTGHCNSIPSPFVIPTFSPTITTYNPTNNPSKNPSLSPTFNPSKNPSLSPTFNPTARPTTHLPTSNPSISPSLPILSTMTGIPLETNNSTVGNAFVIIIVLAISVLFVTMAIIWLFIIKKKQHKNDKTLVHQNIKETELRKTMSSNYGSVLHAKAASNHKYNRMKILKQTQNPSRYNYGYSLPETMTNQTCGSDSTVQDINKYLPPNETEDLCTDLLEESSTVSCLSSDSSAESEKGTKCRGSQPYMEEQVDGNTNDEWLVKEINKMQMPDAIDTSYVD